MTNTAVKFGFIFLLGLLLLSSFTFSVNLMVNASTPCNLTARTSYANITSAFSNAAKYDDILICSDGSAGYSSASGYTLNASGVTIHGSNSSVSIHSPATVGSSTFTLVNMSTTVANLTLFGGPAATVGINSTGNSTTIMHVNFLGFGPGQLPILLSDEHDMVTYNNFTNIISPFAIKVQGSNFDTHTLSYITHNTFTNIAGAIFLNNTHSNNSIQYNTVLGSTGIAPGSSNATFLESNSSNNVFLYNTISNAVTGIYSHLLSNSTNISLNTITNVSGIGIFLNYTNSIELGRNRITNATGVNGLSSKSYGVFIAYSNDTYTIGNTLTRCKEGFYSAYSVNTSSVSNSAYNNTFNGFGVINDINSSFLDSGSYNNSNSGIKVQGSSDGIVINLSRIHNNTVAGVYLYSNTGETTLIANNISDNVYGIEANAGSVDNYLSGNRLVGNEYGIYMLGNSNLTFSGNNHIINSSTGLIYSYVSTLSTGSYKIITPYLEFGLNSTSNVTIDLANLSSHRTVTSISGKTISSAKLVQSSLGYVYGLNVTNTSTSALFSPKFYYNSSDLSGYSANYLGIGESSNLSNAWTFRSGTVSGNSIYKYGLSSFSYFIPLVYLYTQPSSDDDSATHTVELTYLFDCSSGELTATVMDGSSAVSSAEVRLLELSPYFHSTSIDSDSDGEAVFTVTEDGTYKLLASKNNYQFDGSPVTFSLELCSEESPTEPEVVPDEGTPSTPPTEPEVNTSDETQPPEVNTGSDVAMDSASLAIANAVSVISSAKENNMDTSDAESKLAKAQEAYDSGDYELASQLAGEVSGLIKENQIEQASTGENVSEQKGQTTQPDNSIWTYIIGLVILVAVVGGYFFLKGSKKGYKGHKR